MTGIYVRVMRDGAWQSLEVDTLTDGELSAWARQRAHDDIGWAWAVRLAAWIRDHVLEFSVNEWESEDGEVSVDE